MARDILDRLASTGASDRLVDTRDLETLMVAFASRRSEVSRLGFEQLQDEPAVPIDPDPNSTHIPCVAIRLGRTKNDRGGR